MERHGGPPIPGDGFAHAVLAVDTIEGCDYAGISLVEGHSSVRTPVSTHDVVQRSDSLQFRLGEGPALDSIWSDNYVYLPSLAASYRWPRYAREAAKLPIGSLLTYRLFTSRETLGALTLYARGPHAFPDRDHDIGMVFSAQAAAALAAEIALTGEDPLERRAFGSSGDTG